jgi:mono/diheme cytochrome c family protein
MHAILVRLASIAIAIPLLLWVSPAIAADGAALFKTNCAGCHGADGKAETPAAKAMKVPALAGRGLKAEDVVKHVRSSEKHKPVAGKLSDEELAAIGSALPN